MKYLFILGRNLKLSLAEILSYCEKEEIKVESYKIKENLLLVDASEFNVDKAIRRLGGTIALGRVLFFGSREEVIKSIKEKEIYFGNKNKFSYSLFSFDEADEIKETVKNKFKEEKLKAVYVPVSGEIELQEGGKLRNIPFKKAKKIDEKFIFFKDKTCDFGIIEATSNLLEIEERDMRKPVRREELSISPRLAKILINLSQAREGESLLDPFCGIGVILQEALIQGINVVGVDINRKAVENAKKNIKWLEDKYKFKAKYLLINRDSARVKLRRIDAIATEPSLGKLLKSVPKKEEALSFLNRFEDSMGIILRNLKISLKQTGKIAITFPYIKTDKGRVGVNIEKICFRTGLKVYSLKNFEFPIREYREDKIMGREIYVLRNI